MPRWVTEIQQGHRALGDLEDWWDAQTAARTNPLLNSKILRAWQDGLEERNSRFALLVLFRNGEVVAGLPLYKSRFRYRTLLRTYASEMDIVAVPDPEVDAYLPHWINHLDVAYLYRFPDSSPIVQTTEEHGRWVAQARIKSPYVDLSGGIDQVRAEWGKNFRKGLGRRWRRLQEKGEVAYVHHHPSSEVEGVLTKGFDLEASGWKGREGVAVLSQPGYEAWFRSIAEVADHHGWLRLSGLYLNGRMIAFCFDLQYAGRRHSLISAYDEGEDVAPLSPGNALINAVLEDSASDGLGTYELGYGSQGWKYDWTSRERYVNDVLIVGSGVTGRAFSLARRIRR